MAESWVCRKCGASNTGQYCLTCGEPRNMIDWWRQQREEEERIDELYGEAGPRLKDVKELPHDYGTLTAVCFSGWSNGMMMNSHERYSRTLQREEDGTCTLTDEDQSGMRGDSRTVYRADPAVLEKIRAIAVRENMAGWKYLKEHVDPRFIPLDYSGGAGFSLTFDDRSAGGTKSNRISMDPGAVSQHGGGAVLDEIRALMETCRLAENILSVEKTEPKPFGGMTGFMGMGMMTGGGEPPKPEPPKPAAPAREPAPGNWICPACGAENAGKFCAECGSPRPAE